nr:MAG TPA: hypothetical protein [Caudoviricetes sp.]
MTRRVFRILYDNKSAHFISRPERRFFYVAIIFLLT